MAIQTEVTLQPDYICCLRVMGNQYRIAEIVILSPRVPDTHTLRTYPKVSCVNFLSARWRQQSSLLIIIQATATNFPYALFGLVVPCSLSCGCFGCQCRDIRVSSAQIFFLINRGDRGGLTRI